MPRKIDDRDDLVLMLHLRYGLASRPIEEWLKLTKRHGKTAHEILHKFGIHGEALKGCILGCSHDQAVQVLDGIHQACEGAKAAITATQQVINKIAPTGALEMLASYRGRYLLAADECSFHAAVAGEVRNLTQRVFSALKKIVGICQYQGCRKRTDPPVLETAHIGPSRPELFEQHAVRANLESPVKGTVVYDLYDSMRAYVSSHKKHENRVRFLCRTCHNKLETLQKSQSDAKNREDRAAAKRNLKAFTDRID